MSEPEPTYVFKKGEGWVITTHLTYTFEHSNKKWILEDRQPQAGEHYLRLFPARPIDLGYLIALADAIIYMTITPDKYNLWEGPETLRGNGPVVYREL